MKTTGSKGLHVQVPLNGRGLQFDPVREFARQVAEVLAAAEPDLVTVEQRKDARHGQVYADIMRNAYAQTAVAAYSVRARPGAPVATPVSWDEVADPALRADSFTLRSMPDRLAQLAKACDPLGRDVPAPAGADPAAPGPGPQAPVTGAGRAGR